MHSDDFNWRIVIHLSRYSGVYEGGEWFAIFCGDQFPEDAIADDVTCASFWSSEKAKFCGVGGTPDEALKDLFAKNGNARITYGRLYLPVKKRKGIIRWGRN
jgi:hypothetical protein